MVCAARTAEYYINRIVILLSCPRCHKIPWVSGGVENWVIENPPSQLKEKFHYFLFKPSLNEDNSWLGDKVALYKLNHIQIWSLLKMFVLAELPRYMAVGNCGVCNSLLLFSFQSSSFFPTVYSHICSPD